MSYHIMNKILSTIRNYGSIALSLFCLAVFTGCMSGDYDIPSDEELLNSVGNPSITERHLMTIAELKTMYADQMAASGAVKQITEDLQLKATVTGNDISGNIYQEIALQDSTGAIIVGVSASALYGQVAIGSEVLIDLQDLYIGNYRMQPQIGALYNGTIGRMSRYTWQRHFRLTGKSNVIEPEVFADGGSATKWNLDKDAGKLGVIKNVKFSGVGASTTYANPEAGAGSVSLYFQGYDRTVMMYNSNYADFAADKVPTGKVNVTGIVKRYNNSWEFIIRTIDDVQEVE